MPQPHLPPELCSQALQAIWGPERGAAGARHGPPPQGREEEKGRGRGGGSGSSPLRCLRVF